MVLLALALGGAARAGTPLPIHPPDILAAASTPADTIRHLTWLLLAITGAIFVVVEGTLLWAVLRYRRRGARPEDDPDPPQVYGSNPIELAWTVAPLIVVFVLFLVTSRVVFSLERDTVTPDALVVDVIGHQWWWELRYPGLGVVTANELHLPLEDPPRPVYLRLASADVIHSFWVPALAGKLDLIPNHENLLWIEPHEAGVYLGQCAEYCGTQHAHMRVRVVVEPEADFRRWIEAQRSPAEAEPAVAAGRRVFDSYACTNCHRVRGTAAAGAVGPDLTHLMSRATLGAGVAPNDADHLRAWVENPDDLKPGVQMPALGLDDLQITALVSYLRTLR